MKDRFLVWKAGFTDIFNLKDDMGKGRVITILSNILSSFYSVFITGIFYTGFLSAYGISITGVGIISFIPSIASCLGIFSSMILERIPRRKPLLLASKIFYYAVIILGTTVMPEIVHDPDQRLVWFVVLLFIGYSVYALFSSGFTPWFYSFFPIDNQKRTRFLSLQQVAITVTSNVMLLLSGVITDALEGSPYQNQLIIGFRYFAFLLVLLDVFLQSRAKEPTYPRSSEKLRFRQVFTLPFRYRKFILCLSVISFWTFICNLNSGTWGYHLLNHLHFSYTTINLIGLVYPLILFTTLGFWRRVLRRYSWIKTFGIVTLLTMPADIFFFFMQEGQTALYICLCLWQKILAVGMDLAYSNILYLNLPQENSTVHIAFDTIGGYVFAFLGQSLGTWIASWNGGSVPYIIGGLKFYPVQFTSILVSASMLTLGLICVLRWKAFTPQKDIDEIEHKGGVQA